MTLALCFLAGFIVGATVMFAYSVVRTIQIIDAYERRTNGQIPS